MKSLLLLLSGLSFVAAPAFARTRDLAASLAGRTAQSPVDCISLDTNTSPAAYDGVAVYRDGDDLYVNRFNASAVSCTPTTH